MRFFISYPGNRLADAERISKLCQKLGHDVFIAHDHGDEIAGNWIHELSAVIAECDGFILYLAEESLASRWQRREWAQAIANNKDEYALIVHKGPWNSAYGDERYGFLKTVQRFPIEQSEQISGGVRRTVQKWEDSQKEVPYRDQFALMQQCVIEAGTQLMARHSGMRMGYKPKILDNSKNFATEVDVALQKNITDEIRREFPRDAIIAEEKDASLPKPTPDSEFVWTVDALDGTLNFIAGDDRYCCGVGLLHHGRPVLGAILCPTNMELYTGGVKRPAERRRLLDGTSQALFTDKATTKLDDCYTLSHINSTPRQIKLCFEHDFPMRLHKAVRRVWMWGCGLVAMTAVARGTHHLFVQREMEPWDLVPGLALVRAAGGESSLWPAAKPQEWELQYSSAATGVVAAANKQIMEQVFELAKKGAGRA